MNPTELLTTDEVSKILKVSRYLIQKLCRNKQLRYYKIGREFRIDIEDLKKYVEANRV